MPPYLRSITKQTNKLLWSGLRMRTDLRKYPLSFIWMSEEVGDLIFVHVGSRHLSPHPSRRILLITELATNSQAGVLHFRKVMPVTLWHRLIP